MATFSLLPAELVEYIASYLAQCDLYAIARVNKSLSTLAMPYLYRHVDLAIPPGEKIPRIDRFCFNILDDPRRAARVETLRLGPSSRQAVKEGRRWLPRDAHFDDEAMHKKAMAALSGETLITGDYMKEAIIQREYSAYATLIVLILPALQQLDIADFTYSTIDRLHTMLRNLNSRQPWNQRHASEALKARLSSIKTVSCNYDRQTGLRHPNEEGRVHLDEVLNLPSIEKLEFCVTDQQAELSTAFTQLIAPNGWQLITQVRPTNITTLVVRHSTSGPLAIRPVLSCTPQLRSFTWDISYDCNGRDEAPNRWIDLDAWNTSLSAVRGTLEVLVFAAEYFDSSKYPFEQPNIGPRLFGYLDLTSFTRLHTLEVPIPFLTGDVDFSITTPISPLLPPTLHHLSLRLDLSHAHPSYPLDTSILAHSLSLAESQAEAHSATAARMDLAYTYHATLSLLSSTSTPSLRKISIWQPADPGLAWFGGQIADVASACANRGVEGFLVAPLLLRWRNGAHRDLVRERVLGAGGVAHERLCRRERSGVPLGLACQYHLRSLQARWVRG